MKSSKLIIIVLLLLVAMALQVMAETPAKKQIILPRKLNGKGADETNKRYNFDKEHFTFA
jgi:hypothetical protein